MNIPKKYLTERVILIESRIDNMSILRILTQNKQIKEKDADLYYRQLADWANTNQEKTGKIDLNTIELSDRKLVSQLSSHTKHLGATLNQLKNLMDQEGKYNPGSEFSNLIQKTTLEILSGLSKIKNPKPAVTEEPIKKGVDWTAEKARRLASANGVPTSEILDKFYKDYYSQEYAGVATPENDTRGIVSKLKSLDKILIPEFTKLGYNPEVNPLAQFLKILIEEKPEIFKKLTTNTYGAIHNSYASRTITGNMLGNYNEKHLLFCEDLYNRKGLEIVKYLQLYNSTLAQAKNQTQDELILAAKIFIQQDLTTEIESDDSFTSKIIKLLSLQDIQLPTDVNAKLRTIPEIEELYTYIFKATPNVSNQKENKILKLVVDNVKAEDAILDMVYYIAASDAFKKAYPELTANLAQQLKDFTPKNLEICKNILALHGKKIDKQDWPVLIKKLIAAHKEKNKKS